MHAGDGEERLRPAGIQAANSSTRPIRNDHAGGETGLKMHAGEAKNGCGQRVYGGKFLHATVKTIAPAEKQN